MSNKSFLSIGIPVFNQGEFLKNAIDSALDQTLKADEVVVSNNWSTDNTQKIAESFGDRIKLITPPKFLPMSEHWNFLVSNLKNDWFSILSGDDEAKPQFVKTIIDGIKKSPFAILVRGGVDFIDKNGKVLNTSKLLSIKEITRPPQTFYEQLEGSKVNFASFALRKSIWESVGGFPETMEVNGDWGLWLKASLHGEFICQHKSISRYRAGYRPNQKNDRLISELKDDLTVYNEIFPNIYKKISKPNMKKIQKAIKTRFIKRLEWLEKVEDPILKNTAYKLVESSAIKHIGKDIFLRIKNGETISQNSWLKNIKDKNKIRILYNWIKSFK